jgi:ATP synthase protein I
MAFNRPIPEDKPRGKAGMALGGLIEAEKLMQIALTLPAAVLIGWLAGAWADSRLHQSWIAILGVVFGGISGLVYVIRTVMAAEKKSRPGNLPGNGNGRNEQGGPGPRDEPGNPLNR